MVSSPVLVSRFPVGSSAKTMRGFPISDSAVVHPDWRGNGLQRKLLEAALPLVRPGIVGIGATVSPENQYSLNNALACGFVIADRREMYGGYDRYLLKKML